MIAAIRGLTISKPGEEHINQLVLLGTDSEVQTALIHSFIHKECIIHTATAQSTGPPLSQLTQLYSSRFHKTAQQSSESQGVDE